MNKSALKTVCPYCYRPTSAAINHWGDTKPKSGDVGLCAFCGEASMFSDHGRRLRRPSVHEGLEISQHPGAMALRNSWLARISKAEMH